MGPSVAWGLPTSRTRNTLGHMGMKAVTGCRWPPGSGQRDPPALRQTSLDHRDLCNPVAWGTSVNMNVPTTNSLCRLFACIAIVTPARAQTINETAKLLPADGATSDYFGQDVAIEGTTAVIASPGDDDLGGNSGSVYLFDTATETQTVKLLPLDGDVSDSFGCSVAISGTTVLVGAFSDDDLGERSGSAYLFDATTGAQIAKLLAADGDTYDMFGFSVALKGNTAVIGAPGDACGMLSCGSVYLFDTTTGSQIGKLVAADASANATFGWSVSTDGKKVLIGAPGDNAPALDSGSAYLFDLPSQTELFKLVPTNGAYADMFGTSVAIDGATALIGAPYNDDLGGQCGAAYAFDTGTGAQTSKLLSPDGATAIWFGYSVSVAGSTALIGAPAAIDNGAWSGSAQLIDLTTGALITKLLPSDGAKGDFFAVTAAMDGTRAIGGAYFKDDLGTDSGAAYVFTLPGGGCNVVFCDTDANNVGDVTLSTCDCSGGSITLDLSTSFVGQFTYPLVGLGTTAVSPTGVSQLCLAGSAIGRYTKDAGAISAVGTFSVDLLNANSAPGGGVPTIGGALCNGNTWRFQYWHRAGMNPSRFSKGISGTIN